MVIPPAQALTVTVEAPTAPEYGCTFHYDGTDVFSNELVAPIGQAVALQFKTGPTPYSISIPAFRMHETLGERDTSAWFSASATGEFATRCVTRTHDSNYATTSVARVVSGEDYDNWILTDGGKAGPGGVPPQVLGEKLYASLGCIACHSTDGSAIIGPTFQGLFGTERLLADGSTVNADEAYIKQSVLDPASQVAGGFQPVMPPFAGRVTDEDIANLTAFIASLAQ
jgi:cytochrome c oxidase subunit 2